jgi:hypothetical protein
MRLRGRPPADITVIDLDALAVVEHRSMRPDPAGIEKVHFLDRERHKR